MRRKPEYDDFAVFEANYPGQCRACGVGIASGRNVLGTKVGGRWHLVCMQCGHEPVGMVASPRVTTQRRNAEPDTPPVAQPLARTEWSTLVEYLLSCVWQESLMEPVPLGHRQRWAALPIRAEAVLSGNDLELPALPEIAALFDDLEDLEGVFYGWPTIVAVDDRGHPHVAPLFVRQLDKPGKVSELLPRVNMGLLTQQWFPHELLANAAKVIAREAIGFGLRKALTETARSLLHALGIPPGVLDPAALIDATTLDSPWRPQEVGVFNMAMAFKGELDIATRQLVKDLEWMRGANDWRGSAARYLFEDAPGITLAPLTSCPVQLNHSQETALAAASTSPLTVITGPPGTGKSQTVTAIIADAWRRGDSVLLASTNNAPIDDVVSNKATDIDDALVLRTGNAEKRTELARRLRALLTELPDRTPPATPSPVRAHAAARHEAAYELAQRAQAESRLLRAAVERDRLRAELWSVSLPPVPELWPSVRRVAVKAAGTRWRWLRRRCARTLRQQLNTPDSTTPLQILEWLNAETEFGEAGHAVAALTGNSAADVMAAFAQADQEWRTASRAQVSIDVHRGLVAGAGALSELAERLDEELPAREATQRVMQYVKGWATTALSARSNFDCRAGVVDLVVIDEASQCTLAHVLPLAYRAKRLVIVGDPQQLKPVVTIDNELLRTLAVEAGTTHAALVAARHTYGEDSAFTAFAARVPNGPLLLDEHYRCHPEIIRFCNEQFYDGRLQVLTSVDAEGPRGLDWHDVAGTTEPGVNGSVLNRAEAEAVAAWVLASGLSRDQVAVVTPFRPQARLIRSLLEEQMPGVRVGTAHTFQGGECETVVFSTVLSEGAQAGTVAWVEGERNLINVAVSRARKHLVVFGNAAALAQFQAPTLQALAHVARTSGAAATSASPYLLRLHQALLDRGIPTELNTFTEGYQLGLAITGAGNAPPINVEVSEYRRPDDVVRLQRQWQRRDDNVRGLGWHVERVPAWRAYLEPHRVADELVARRVSGLGRT